ncbi:VRR-NUC domain-containing protein [Enterococcus sp. CSURQ0835]|uniref:VRR-NUC domain-containing protein n=1 Tax=Enterococcus sp. CSURQ0835 TaxID=2681394 RepID=UPI001358C12D|nr:VRR-NUC domain-containing protein [Enterococcus sp. CSURQ0835]
MELEKDVESYFKNKVRNKGGLSLKWVSTIRGIPDQLVMFPNGKTVFVEMKRPNGTLRKSQDKMTRTLRNLNQQVYVCYSKKQADMLVKEFQERGYFDASKIT